MLPLWSWETHLSHPANRPILSVIVSLASIRDIAKCSLIRHHTGQGTSAFADRTANGVRFKPVETLFEALLQRRAFGTFADDTSLVVLHVSVSTLPKLGSLSGRQGLPTCRSCSCSVEDKSCLRHCQKVDTCIRNNPDHPVVSRFHIEEGSVPERGSWQVTRERSAL